MSRFSGVPGITDGGGWRNYIVGVAYVVVIVFGVAMVGATAGVDDDAGAAAGDVTPTGTAPATEAPETEAPETEPPETVAPAPDGESYSFSGSGNSVTDGFEAEGGLVVLDFTHAGESNFQVQAVGETEEYLVNHIGNYDGEVALALPAGEYQLDVTADGDWSAEVTQPRFNENDIESLPASASGEHAAWFGPYEFSDSTEVTFEIENDAQGSVWLTTHEGEQVDLVHNEIGPYEGSALINQDGYGLIIVDTDSAEWRLEIGE